jgi:peptidoglycan lytic transglycosylase
LAVRYTGRHVRQARHGAWVNKKRSRVRKPPTQLLPAAAALTVAGFLVGGAGAAIGLSPASNASEFPTYDPADIPPPDPSAGVDVDRVASPAALTETERAYAPAVVASGSCEVSYKGSGQRTASGEEYDPTALTAAHESLPFNTLVRVINPANGESVVVRINDRGPYYGDRCLDLTVGAFASIADPSAGVVDVRYEVLAQDAT